MSIFEHIQTKISGTIQPHHFQEVHFTDRLADLNWILVAYLTCVMPVYFIYTIKKLKYVICLCRVHRHSLIYETLINFEEWIYVLCDLMGKTHAKWKETDVCWVNWCVCKGIHYFILIRRSEKLASIAEYSCLFTSLSTLSIHIHFTIINECISSALAVLNCGNVYNSLNTNINQSMLHPYKYILCSSSFSASAISQRVLQSG